MKRMSVISSNLKSIGYDELNQVLEIEFQDNSVYQYSRVPLTIYKKLMSSESKGSYFAKEVRKNPERYPYRKIRSSVKF